MGLAHNSGEKIFVALYFFRLPDVMSKIHWYKDTQIYRYPTPSPWSFFLTSLLDNRILIVSFSADRPKNDKLLDETSNVAVHPQRRCGKGFITGPTTKRVNPPMCAHDNADGCTRSLGKCLFLRFLDHVFFRNSQSNDRLSIAQVWGIRPSSVFCVTAGQTEWDCTTSASPLPIRKRYRHLGYNCWPVAFRHHLSIGLALMMKLGSQQSKRNSIRSKVCTFWGVFPWGNLHD